MTKLLIERETLVQVMRVLVDCNAEYPDGPYREEINALRALLDTPSEQDDLHIAYMAGYHAAILGEKND